MPIGFRGFQKGNKLSRMTGKKHSLEARKNMSLAGKGRIFTDEHRANMSKSMTGKTKPPFTEEHLRKLSEAQKERFSKIKQWNTGVKMSDEFKLKISKATSGVNNPFFGKKHSDKAKKLVSESRKGKPTTLGTKRPYSVGVNNPANRPEVKLKIAESKRGSKNPNWKGGISPLNVRIRQSPEMKLWRKSVFERDNYTCVWCRARNGNGETIILHADHIKPFALFPELRFAIDNGRTLCITCHKTTESYGWKKSDYQLNKKI